MNLDEYADLELSNSSVFSDFSVDNLFSFPPAPTVSAHTGDEGMHQSRMDTQSPLDGAAVQEPTAATLATVLDTVGEQAIIEYLKARAGTRPTSRHWKDSDSKASQRSSPVPGNKRREYRQTDVVAEPLPNRQHYAVEKRYRSALNAKYAKLTDAVLQNSTQRICQTAQPDWNMQALEGSNRLNKTATLSAALETIDMLVVCCERKTNELEALEKGRRTICAQARELLRQGISGTM